MFCVFQSPWNTVQYRMDSVGQANQYFIVEKNPVTQRAEIKLRQSLTNDPLNSPSYQVSIGKRHEHPLPSPGGDTLYLKITRS